jgi:hypothetical protein
MTRFIFPTVAPVPRPYRGLGWWRRRARDARGLGLTGLPPAPFGWRWLKEEHRSAAICFPLWLYWPALFWRERYGRFFEPLMRMGLWDVNDGDRYVDGRLTAPRWLRAFVWCFLNDRDRVPICTFCGRPSTSGRYPGAPPRYRAWARRWWKCIPCIDRDIARDEWLRAEGMRKLRAFVNRVPGAATDAYLAALDR